MRARSAPKTANTPDSSIGVPTPRNGSTCTPVPADPTTTMLATTACAPVTVTTTGTVGDGRSSPSRWTAPAAARATSTAAPTVGSNGSTPSSAPDNSNGTWYTASQPGPDARSTSHPENSARGATIVTSVNTVTTSA